MHSEDKRNDYLFRIKGMQIKEMLFSFEFWMPKSKY